jgi:hypothetical protein
MNSAKLVELRALANQIAKMQADAEDQFAHDYWKTAYSRLHCAASIGIDAIERAIARIEELEAKLSKPASSNRREWCNLCDRWATVCGKCNSPSCSGGIGYLVDGTKCDQCRSAHEEDQAIPQEPRPTSTSTEEGV